MILVLLLVVSLVVLGVVLGRAERAAGRCLYALNTAGPVPCVVCQRGYDPEVPHVCVTETEGGATRTTVIIPQGQEHRLLADLMSPSSPTLS